MTAPHLTSAHNPLKWSTPSTIAASSPSSSPAASIDMSNSYLTIASGLFEYPMRTQQSTASMSSVIGVSPIQTTPLHRIVDSCANQSGHVCKHDTLCDGQLGGHPHAFLPNSASVTQQNFSDLRDSGGNGSGNVAGLGNDAIIHTTCPSAITIRVQCALLTIESVLSRFDNTSYFPEQYTHEQQYSIQRETLNIGIRKWSAVCIYMQYAVYICQTPLANVQVLGYLYPDCGVRLVALILPPHGQKHNTPLFHIVNHSARTYT